MIKIGNDKIVFFDVDDTLVMWGSPPLDYEGQIVRLNCHGWQDNYAIYDSNILAMKEHKKRGHTVIVWTQGGVDWAEAVVKGLGLEEYVDAVMSKPSWVYDDLPTSAWMPQSKFGFKHAIEELKS